MKKTRSRKSRDTVLEDAVGNVKEEEGGKDGEKPYMRSGSMYYSMYYSYVCINVCPTRNHVILKDAFTVPYFQGMHSISSANRKVLVTMYIET